MANYSVIVAAAIAAAPLNTTIKICSDPHSLKLLHVCDEKGIESHHIESSDQLDKDWFIKKQHVGITAGTSTPENVINEVHTTILEIAKEIEDHSLLSS